MFNRFISKQSRSFAPLIQKATIQTESTSSTHVRIGLCQILVQKDKEVNIKNASKLIDEAKDPNIVVWFVLFSFD
jgi:hypothetical protein